VLVDYTIVLINMTGYDDICNQIFNFCILTTNRSH